MKIFCYGNIILTTSCFIILICSINAYCQPSWVTKKPIQDDYYIGIGYSEKKPDNSHINIAKKQALQNIASEIKITVSSQSVASVIETNEQIEETFQQDIISSTEADLQNYELIDSWENKQDYWVYYRLSKRVYQDIQRKKKRQAIALAADFYKKAYSKHQNDQVIEAINLYIQVLHTLKNYLNEPNEFVFNNEKILLANEAYQNTYQILSAIQLDASREELEVKQLSKLSTNLQIKARYVNQSNNKKFPLKDVNIKFSFAKGDGNIQAYDITDEQGIATAKLTKVSSTLNNQIILVTLNLPDQVDNGKKEPFIDTLLEKMRIPSTTIKLTVKKQKLYLQIEEYVNEKQTDSKKIESIIKNYLSDLGYAFVSDKSTSELIFKVTARATDGGEKFGLYTSFVDVDFSIINDNNKNVFHTSLQGIKGMQLSYKKAAYDAMDKAARKLIEKLDNNSNLF